ncbi:MAG TPA: sarcosine oxidase subunit delta [Noviherbaspirillum sp.]|uniref:sarcosine oxidase subunit delta n=1 Tax=Noviherbaspirillum sp. TaxID=1926288 RepID=UPI002B47A0E5|nr:sarcosine oxidase subunit delta [Noviherbaspirillum sp.]HJV86755.1 sarcosine oxidase subunit delta [Noviherbaspirillum sp.]
MMQLTCPWCGTRPESEFHCGGQTAIARPGPAYSVADETWGEYLFFRDNPRGVHAERWRHTFGCGQWFNVLRDTVTHEVHAVYDIVGKPPALAGKGETR